MKTHEIISFPPAVFDYLDAHTLIGIRAGQERETFLQIWMVTVEQRIFARSWGMAERSWYNTFLKGATGALQCGELVVPVIGVIPPDPDVLTEKINAAYLAKYDFGENSFYARGIIAPAHAARTMEFQHIAV